MSELLEGRPMAVINEAWRQYKAWAQASREEKRKQDSARKWTLILGVIGAALATTAGMVEGFDQGEVHAWLSRFITLEPETVGAWLSGLVPLLSTLSALAIATAGFIGKELLTPERENLWARCRIVAEAIQRQVWLALMKAPPYDGDDAADRLAEIAKTLGNLEDVTQPLPEPGKSSGNVPEVDGIDAYIDTRVNDQIVWYRNKAEVHRKKLLYWRRMSLVLGIVAIAFSTFGAIVPYLPNWVPVVTSMSAAVFALIQSGRLQTLPPLYQQTAAQLSMTLAMWQDKNSKTMGASDFVIWCEDIMAKENDSWRMEQFSKQADGSANGNKDLRNGGIRDPANEGSGGD